MAMQRVMTETMQFGGYHFKEGETFYVKSLKAWPNTVAISKQRGGSSGFRVTRSYLDSFSKAI